VNIHPAPQGSPEWHEARLGIPTASQFHRIVTPAKLKPGSGAETYRMELLAEWVSGIASDAASGPFLERGTEQESHARGWYAFERDVEPVEVGLCLSDDGLVGASPDALVGEDGLLEIKTPGLAKHLGFLLAGPGREYALQIQGQLWVTGREWCDWVSFNPDPSIPSKLLRYPRVPEIQDALTKYIPEFVAELALAKSRLIARGVVPACDRAPVRSFADAEGIPEFVSDDEWESALNRLEIKA